MSMQFNGFTPDGFPTFRPSPISDWEQLTRPRPARFASAHLLFAPGSFVKDVPCDPELYFTGDEGVLAVRAYTHGYDLFEPSRVVLWHEYSRNYRPKHWDDHSDGTAGPAWHDRETISRTRIRQIFDDLSVGRFWLGSERTLAEYESYAGVNFQYRKVQDYTRQNREPPNPPADPDWFLHVGRHRLALPLDASHLSREMFDDVDFCYASIQDSAGRVLHDWTVAHDELAGLRAKLAEGKPLALTPEFESQADPVMWAVTPHTEACGWLEPLTGTVNDTASASVLLDTHRPARVPGITWESAGDRHIASVPGNDLRRRELNSSGALLVELADGRHSVREIATYLRRAHRLAEDPASEVLDFYESARSAGLVTIGDDGETHR